MSENKDGNELTDVYDEGEIASAYEMEFIQRAIERQQEQMKPETHPDFDGIHCIECDVEIPEGRLKMKKIRCVECQTLLEEKNKRKY